MEVTPHELDDAAWRKATHSGSDGTDCIEVALLSEGRVGMHTLVVFFSIVGGIGYFGILGMFIGPLVFAMVIAFLEFYIESTASSSDSP